MISGSQRNAIIVLSAWVSDVRFVTHEPTKLGVEPGVRLACSADGTENL